MVVKISKTKDNPIDNNKIFDHFGNKTSNSFSEEKVIRVNLHLM